MYVSMQMDMMGVRENPQNTPTFRAWACTRGPPGCVGRACFVCGLPGRYEPLPLRERGRGAALGLPLLFGVRCCIALWRGCCRRPPLLRLLAELHMPAALWHEVWDASGCMRLADLTKPCMSLLA